MNTRRINRRPEKDRREAVAEMKSAFKAPAKVRPQENDDIGPEAWDEIRRQMEKDK